MDKSVEGIRRQLNIGIGMIEWDGEFSNEAYNKIINIAESMEKEIERLESDNNKLKTAVTASGFIHNSEGDLQEAIFECAISNDNLRKEIDRLKAELEDKNQQISDMRSCLHDYEERMNELEKRPEVNCDQTNCKHNTEKKCVSSKLYFEYLYRDNGRMDCYYFQRRESEGKTGEKTNDAIIRQNHNYNSLRSDLNEIHKAD